MYTYFFRDNQSKNIFQIKIVNLFCLEPSFSCVKYVFNVCYVTSYKVIRIKPNCNWIERSSKKTFRIYQYQKNLYNRHSNFVYSSALLNIASTKLYYIYYCKICIYFAFQVVDMYLLVTRDQSYCTYTLFKILLLLRIALL